MPVRQCIDADVSKNRRNRAVTHCGEFSDRVRTPHGGCRWERPQDTGHGDHVEYFLAPRRGPRQSPDRTVPGRDPGPAVAGPAAVDPGRLARAGDRRCRAGHARARAALIPPLPTRCPIGTAHVGRGRQEALGHATAPGPALGRGQTRRARAAHGTTRPRWMALRWSSTVRVMRMTPVYKMNGENPVAQGLRPHVAISHPGVGAGWLSGEKSRGFAFAPVLHLAP